MLQNLGPEDRLDRAEVDRTVAALAPLTKKRDRRISAHVLVYIIALVIERMIQRRLDEAGLDLEAPRALEELARIRAAVETLGSRTFRVRTEPTPQAVAILKACRVQLPPRVEELTDERKALK